MIPEQHSYLNSLSEKELVQLKNSINNPNQNHLPYVKLYFDNLGKLQVNRVQMRENPNPTSTAKIASVFTHVLNQRQIVEKASLLPHINAALASKRVSNTAQALTRSKVTDVSPHMLPPGTYIPVTSNNAASKSKRARVSKKRFRFFAIYSPNSKGREFRLQQYLFFIHLCYALCRGR